VNADLSVAPEIAQLAAPAALNPPPGYSPAYRCLATTGQLAAGLSRLAATPQRWWDLVRFSPHSPARTVVPAHAVDSEGTEAPAPFQAWLLVIPPGQAAKCDCELAALVAGEAAVDGSPLQPGRVRVHGAPGEHLHASVGDGYSVTLHLSTQGSTARSPSRATRRRRLTRQTVGHD
jgi:hypothetical protein